MLESGVPDQTMLSIGIDAVKFNAIAHMYPCSQVLVIHKMLYSNIPKTLISNNRLYETKQAKMFQVTAFAIPLEWMHVIFCTNSEFRFLFHFFGFALSTYFAKGSSQPSCFLNNIHSIEPYDSTFGRDLECHKYIGWHHFRQPRNPDPPLIYSASNA